MSSRVKSTIILAVVLMVLVIGAAALLTVSGAGAKARWVLDETWVQPAPSVASMKVTNLSGTGKTDLFVQAENSVLVFDAAGQAVYDQAFPGTLAASMGDVDGDGVQEILAYYKPESKSVAAAFQATGGGQRLWQTEIAGLGDVGRAAVVDFDGEGRMGLVIGDLRGKLVALSDQGEEQWRYDLHSSSDLRGLDSVLTGRTQLVAAADLDGRVAVLDGQGQAVWTFNVPGGLRRLRTEELGAPGQSAVLLGGEDGTLYVLDGSTGRELWRASLGQAITEIRLAELDGDPGTRELVAGGKRNGVWGYTQDGERLFAASIAGDKAKVTEIASLDVAGTGKNVVAIGDDSGAVTFFDAEGHKLLTRSYSAPINRMATGKVGGERQFLVADASQVHALTMIEKSPALWSSPLLGGLLACLVIAGVAYAIASMKPAPTLHLSAEEMSVEAQKARRIMLHESINELRRMKESGEVPADAYLARLKDLRSQLADAEANLIRLGVRLTAETIKCPNCGGTLELGTDRCDYCGQTVLI
ncbi:MAG: PQQ-binding-like beta-propeller repeat protein [Anaerolineae bacterium]|nr:PQQ-binding-like beta-propeller repeat protein [Anaerolineae bacterium]